MKRASVTAVKLTKQRDYTNISVFRFDENPGLITIAAVRADGKMRFERAGRQTDADRAL